MFVTWQDINVKHHAMDMCSRGEERKRKQRREEEVRRITEVAFQAYGIPLLEV